MFLPDTDCYHLKSLDDMPSTWIAARDAIDKVIHSTDANLVIAAGLYGRPMTDFSYDEFDVIVTTVREAENKVRAYRSVLSDEVQRSLLNLAGRASTPAQPQVIAVRLTSKGFDGNVV